MTEPLTLFTDGPVDGPVVIKAPEVDLPTASTSIGFEAPTKVVAPDVVAATQPCTTCDGTGTVTMPGHADLCRGDDTCQRTCPVPVPERCPRCIDGKPRVALYTKCDHTNCRRTTQEEWACIYWQDDGRVLVGEGTIQLAPVVDFDGCKDSTLHVCKPTGAPDLTWYVHLPLTDDAEQTEFLVIIEDELGPGDTVIIWTRETES
jgi:hypothetical protein